MTTNTREEGKVKEKEEKGEKEEGEKKKKIIILH